MTDYGHPLLFGSFITPVAADPERTVGLAVLSEQAGLDLVTFQDHPYQPAFLDTWTLLSYVAARTSRVRLAANVTNLPLRPPAVLARSVASLDLLSGGRAELGLGAGAFWDAIEAMGGRRLRPGQARQALDEAIAIIRQTWAADQRGGVRLNGEFYQVNGAKRGPAPAHDVGIWLGAYKPGMLALTGRAADGWLPSLGYLQPGDLAAGHKIIDEAAQQAGRSPDQIRRLLNVSGQFGPVSRGPLDGPADQWAEELAELALSDGVSAFIVAADDPDDLRRFAAEVAPAVRELVAAERATAPTAPATGPAAAPATPNTAPATPAATSFTSAASASSATMGGAFALVPTPDDGTRRSPTRVWDEADRPTGPARDPARTYTAQEQADGGQLIEVHNALRAELDQIFDLIDQVAAGTMNAATARSQLNEMTMRQNNWTLGTYCESYCRVVTMHHTLEDQSLFPQLRRRDPRLTPVIERLQAEHRVIHDVLDDVDRALVAFVSTDDRDAALSGLRAATDLLSDSLRSHLSYEERELVEPIARLGIL
jgi:alkanesulfonate monooxygenase SsuD/methylene tetrahydromethanopterin reductase-like flavin-dependent oxidoreductase (luciferase family)/hemerythrin-like domain-containing protein